MGNPDRTNPVPTRYRHVLFRSRLEARWAVFFDALNLKWHYEPEGFALADKEWYLPDFWLPEVGWFCEVKPYIGIFYSEDKARRFARDTRWPILLLDGAPSFKGYAGLEEFRGSTLEEIYSLDIAEHSKTFTEHRLWSDLALNGEIPAEGNFSRRYINAVEAALSADFAYGN